MIENPKVGMRVRILGGHGSSLAVSSIHNIDMVDGNLIGIKIQTGGMWWFPKPLVELVEEEDPIKKSIRLLDECIEMIKNTNNILRGETDEQGK